MKTEVLKILVRNMETKRNCRKFHIELRNQMKELEISEKSREICKQLLCSEWYEKCTLIYGYYPLGNEVDCRYFLEKALADKKRVVLPRTREDCSMEFYEIQSLGEVEEGAFHVMEPIETCPIVKEEDGVVLVPGVVFDRNGNRYGYGKGYYDRYFSRFPKLKRYALSYENQLEEMLEVLDTDIKMHCIYTETACYKAGGKA